MSPIPTITREFQLPGDGSYENLSLREAPIALSTEGQVLVKIHAVSLNYRDIMIANGSYPVKLPDNLVPCSDMAGEVIAVGKDVTEWKSGDRVCANFCTDFIYGDVTPEIQATALGGAINGVLTEYKVFKPHSLVAIPDHLSYEEASTLPCAALSAYNALLGPVPLKAGDTVLVQGTGGVSIFGLQIAVASGATVIVTSSSDKKLEVAKKLGAKHVINYKETPNWDEEVLKITNGRGVDHILEVGGPGTLEKSMKSVRVAGRIHVIGFLASADSPNITLYTIMKAATLRGIQTGSVAQFKDMNRLLAAHPEATRPVIDKVFPFKDAVKAWAHLESQAFVGKIVIKVSDN
ncbi:hypothetical protein C8J56DRAFT_1168887 [Mycena floridula]|nr:hypothetical protein C8J56DRAFT_1168887 [Mycena floridula]